MLGIIAFYNQLGLATTEGLFFIRECHQEPLPLAPTRQTIKKVCLFETSLCCQSCNPALGLKLKGPTTNGMSIKHHGILN